MTLVLSCITHDYVIQASDRRVTFTDGSVPEDQANKAVIFCGQSTWAYSGLAQIYGKRTDQWITDQFSLGDALQDAIKRLAADGTRGLRTARWPSAVRPSQRRILTRLTVTGVGFAKRRLGPRLWGPRRPYIATVSNSYDSQGNWLDAPARQLSPRLEFLPDESTFLVHATGQVPPSGIRKELVRSVRRATDRPLRPHAAARLLTRSIQETAKVNNAVGANVMCMVIPRPGTTAGDASLRSSPIPLGTGVAELDRFRAMKDYSGGKEFFYTPADQDAQIYYGPVSVCAGTVAGGLIFGPEELVAQLGDRGPFPPYSPVSA